MRSVWWRPIFLGLRCGRTVFANAPPFCSRGGTSTVLVDNLMKSEMEVPKGLRVRPPRIDDIKDVLAVMNAHEGIYGPEARSLLDDLGEGGPRPSLAPPASAWGWGPK